MRRDHAETVAARAFEWLVGHERLFPEFINFTGLDVGDVRLEVNDSSFLSSVLDFIALEDARVIEFGDAMNLPYDAILRARAALPGGGEVHWT